MQHIFLFEQKLQADVWQTFDWAKKKKNLPTFCNDDIFF
jgi:hypothetical protein